MPTVTTPTRSNGRRPAEGVPPSRGRAPGLGGRRQMPLVVIGVLLVVGCALAFAEVSLHTGTRQQVLVTSEPLAAGQVLAPGDVRTATISAGSGLEAIPAGGEAAVVGRPVAVPLAAGVLLTETELGAPSPVSAAWDVVAVGLKAGQYPPGLSVGDQVQVVPVATESPAASVSSGGAGEFGRPVSATVLSIAAAPAGSGGPTVFSLQVAKASADDVASLAVAGEVSLVELGTGG